MVFETYLDDPILESKMRVCKDASGLWYIFRSDGREYVYDSAADLAGDYAKMIGAYYKKQLQEAIA